MGVVDIAKLLGVSRQRADQLSRQKGFPEPVDVIHDGRVRVWDRAEVERWAASRPS